MSEYILIGRHNLTPVQTRLLQKLGLTKEVARISHVENLNEVINLAKENGVNTIVVQALPLPLLAQLLQLAKRSNIRVLTFKLEPVGLFQSLEEAEKYGDVIIPSREGTYRVMKTTGVEQVEEIRIVTKTLATA